MDRCGFDGPTKGIADPRCMATCILARTLSNLMAVRHLIHGKHIVEARTIARCCYENSFWMQGLAADGDAFVHEMRRDEAASFQSRMESIFATVGRLDDPEKGKGLRERLRANKKLNPKPLSVKEASARGPLVKGYTTFSQLSADAVHTSLSALMRYLMKTAEDDHLIYTVEAVPAPRPGEAVKTLEWACGAAIGVIVGVNQIYKGTPATELISQLHYCPVNIRTNSIGYRP